VKSTLVGLRAEHFRHPLDQQATRSLQVLPGLDVAVRSLLGPVAEQIFCIENLASSVQVSDRQLPDLHRLLLDACHILDLEAPQLYVKQHPVPNAYTFAMRGRQPFVVLHTALIELLDPEEIQAVIAHELGHLKCEHGVYLTLANLIVVAAGQLPEWGTVLAQGMQMQLMQWLRCAEFSCDRAALLATQNPRVVASVLMKLAGGSPKLMSQLNLDAFIDQARAYEALDSDVMANAFKQILHGQLTHPVPVLRAKEIDRWGRSTDYQSLLQTRPVRYNRETTLGGWWNW
jgi:Zn-dependent protease with chaperone function